MMAAQILWRSKQRRAMPLIPWQSVTAGLMLLTLGAIDGLGAEPIFRAGAALVDVSPPTFPIRTAGNLTLTVAEKSLDPLHVRAIVLDDGKTAAAIAVIDSCMVDRETMDAAKAIASRETGIPPEQMLISSTHTHS